jgi:hypothetical protein
MNFYSLNGKLLFYFVLPSDTEEDIQEVADTLWKLVKED